MLQCLIVEDEPIARDLLIHYCSHLTQLNVVASCRQALEARNVLSQQPVDILFLDIHMPLLDGMSFLKTVKNPPQVIFTTAYQEYAVQAFELSACDYLVKPFSLERFIVAVDKAIDRLQPLSKALASAVPDYCFFKAMGKIYKLAYQDLLFAEAKGNYVHLTTNQAILKPEMPFSSLEKLLPQALFIRVHRSFLINQSKITHIEGNRVLIGQNEIPIGSHYKASFLKAIGL